MSQRGRRVRSVLRRSSEECCQNSRKNVTGSQGGKQTALDCRNNRGLRSIFNYRPQLLQEPQHLLPKLGRRSLGRLHLGSFGRQSLGMQSLGKLSLGMLQQLFFLQQPDRATQQLVLGAQAEAQGAAHDAPFGPQAGAQAERQGAAHEAPLGPQAGLTSAVTSLRHAWLQSTNTSGERSASADWPTNYRVNPPASRVPEDGSSRSVNCFGSNLRS